MFVNNFIRFKCSFRFLEDNYILAPQDGGQGLDLVPLRPPHDHVTTFVRQHFTIKKISPVINLKTFNLI